jgi:hypothetical protein
MKNELTKSLIDLIDETIREVDELKKSRFAAAEIEIKGPGEGIAGKPSNGDLHAKKAEDKDEDDKDEDDKDKDDAKKAEGTNEEAAKAEGTNEEAAKAEDDKKKDKKDEKEPHKDDPKHEEKEKEMAKKLLDMHKAQEEATTLMKSFVEERVRPLEDKLSTILDLVNKIADAPIPAKGASARAVPLMKSADEAGGESLSKGEIASKLFELKKSGTKVDSLDITKAEMGQDLNKILAKYKIS